MPTSGRASASSSRPMPLSIARAGARSTPSVSAALCRFAGSVGRAYGSFVAHSGRLRDDGCDERAAEHFREGCDLRERRSDLAERRLVQDEVERRLALVEPLHELRDRDLVRGEPRRGVREHARLVGDVEMDVEGGAPRVRVEPLELAPARVVLEEAGAGGADDAHEVCNDGGGRFRPACARALERDLANRVALQHDGVERRRRPRRAGASARRTPAARARRPPRRRAWRCRRAARPSRARRRRRRAPARSR